MSEAFKNIFVSRPNIYKYFVNNNKFECFINNLVDENVKKNKISNDNNLIIDIITNEVTRIFRDEVLSKKIKKQLKKYKIISTADHHGLLHYDLLLNSNILFSEIIKKINLDYLIVLSSGSVPLCNISYPRGFYFQNKKYNFFPKKYNNTPVCLLNENSFKNSNSINDIVINLDDNLDKEKIRFLEKLFFDTININEITNENINFSDQISILNRKIWKTFFNSSIRDKVPELIYLQLEKIIGIYLEQELKNDSSLLSLILFEEKVRNIYLNNFKNIQGCWGDNSGTEFFWGVSKKNKLIKLKINKKLNALEGKEFYLDINNEEIINAIKKQKIIPNVMLVFLIITFMNDYVALGGFNQIDYLPKMQNAHIKSLKEIGKNELAQEFSTRITDGFICGMMPLEFDSSIDMLWHYNSENGIFNGNLDNGICYNKLDKILNMKVPEMIHSATETMAGILK